MLYYPPEKFDGQGRYPMHPTLHDHLPVKRKESLWEAM